MNKKWHEKVSRRKKEEVSQEHQYSDWRRRRTTFPRLSLESSFHDRRWRHKNMDEEHKHRSRKWNHSKKDTIKERDERVRQRRNNEWTFKRTANCVWCCQTKRKLRLKLLCRWKGFWIQTLFYCDSCCGSKREHFLAKVFFWEEGCCRDFLAKGLLWEGRMCRKRPFMWDVVGGEAWKKERRVRSWNLTIKILILFIWAFVLNAGVEGFRK